MNRVKRHGAEDRLKGREQTKSACIATTRAKLTNSQELPGSALLNTGSRSAGHVGCADHLILAAHFAFHVASRNEPLDFG